MLCAYVLLSVPGPLGFCIHKGSGSSQNLKLPFDGEFWELHCLVERDWGFQCACGLECQLGVVGTLEVFWAASAEWWHWGLHCPHEALSGLSGPGAPALGGMWGCRSSPEEGCEDELRAGAPLQWRKANSHEHGQIHNSTVIVNVLLSISEVSAMRITEWWGPYPDSSGPWDEDRSCWVAPRRQPSFLHAYTPFLSLLCTDKEISISCMWGSARLFADILSNTGCMS